MDFVRINNNLTYLFFCIVVSASISFFLTLILFIFGGAFSENLNYFINYPIYDSRITRVLLLGHFGSERSSVFMHYLAGFMVRWLAISLIFLIYLFFSKRELSKPYCAACAGINRRGIENERVSQRKD